MAVLWMDLMFDTQVLRYGSGPLPEEILSSIAAYYARVTTDAEPMGRLVGLVMIATVGGAIYEVFRGDSPRGLAVAAVLAVGIPMILALTRVLPDAVRLGSRADAAAAQSELARSICHDHLLCLASILVFVGIQVFAMVRSNRHHASAA